MKANKYYLAVIPLILITSCNNLQYEKKLTTLKVSTSILDCEEENIHLKIIEAKDSSFLERGILPVCGKEDSLCKKVFYKMLDTTKHYIIRGFLSKKSHNYFDYGCTDLKAIFIKDIELITKEVSKIN